MIGVNFDREKAARFIESLIEGRPVTNTEGCWTIDEMLMLAGACFFAISSHGPWGDRISKLAGVEVPGDVPLERQEAVEQMHQVDLHGAIDFCAELVMRIVDGEYDEFYEERVVALLRGDSRDLSPIAGFRKGG